MENGVVPEDSRFNRALSYLDLGMPEEAEKIVPEASVPSVAALLASRALAHPKGSPDFLNIIEDTVRIRDKYFPNAKVSVLSNATMIGKEDVRKALMKVDNNILKLDTIDAEYIKLVDRPTQPSYDVRNVIENMKKFNGHCIIQTMFMTGTTQGKSVDNTGEEFVAPWLEAVKDIAPEMVMIYTIDRETPDHDLRKASHETLDAIKTRVEDLGIKCSASY